ncbi:hypothetical protein I3843_16G014900 [Carya illinoinensis]|nr:hypothetical protein I3843_16G014900 [Carya illinoinensis]
MTDPEDIAAYRKSIERLRVHIFLAGLDGDFEQVRGEILRKEPVPDLEGCYFLVRREAVRHATLKGESENSEDSAMVARNGSNQNWQNHPKTTNGTDKSTYKCTQCNQTCHTKSRCFELVRYSKWWDHSRDTWKKNSKKTSTAAIVETKTEDDVAKKASALIITASNGGKALNISTPVFNSAWIIDSGATDHMTFDSRQASTINPSSQKFVSTANGASTPIIGEGSLTLTSTLNLDSVLVVPSLDYNLLSVSQITTTLSCVVIFGLNFVCLRTFKQSRRLGMPPYGHHLATTAPPHLSLPFPSFP